MKTELARVNPNDPEAGLIQRAAAVIRGGGLVAFPTETVYGLGANALDAAAVSKIFVAKGRPANNPLIVHVADIVQARRVVTEWKDSADGLAAAFWPGPLTLVLSRRDVVPRIVTGGGETVAVRVPAHPVALRLVEAAGCPIAAPSANVSNAVSPTAAEHVTRTLDGRIEMVLDGGPCRGGIESTVVDLTTMPPRILRPGLVTRSEIEAVIGAVDQPTLFSDKQCDALPSPGVSPRHYAPRATVEGFADKHAAAARVSQLTNQGRKAGSLRCADSHPASDLNLVEPMPNAPVEYARELYRRLHQLDEQMVDYIIVSLPPDQPEWHAVRDRLRRAASVWEE